MAATFLTMNERELRELVRDIATDGIMVEDAGDFTLSVCERLGIKCNGDLDQIARPADSVKPITDDDIRALARSQSPVTGNVAYLCSIALGEHENQLCTKEEAWNKCADIIRVTGRSSLGMSSTKQPASPDPAYLEPGFGYFAAGAAAKANSERPHTPPRTAPHGTFTVELSAPNVTTRRFFGRRDLALAYVAALYVRFPDLMVDEVDPDCHEWFAARTDQLLPVNS